MKQKKNVYSNFGHTTTTTTTSTATTPVKYNRQTTMMMIAFYVVIVYAHYKYHIRIVYSFNIHNEDIFIYL